VTVAPAAATVATGGSTQFQATVRNATNTTVQWRVNDVAGGSAGIGTISPFGLYQAPASVPAVEVKVTAVLEADAARFGSAEVTVVPPMTVVPRQAALTTSQTLQLLATGPGVTGSGVDWSASGGLVTAGGMYVPSGSGTFVVTATSRADPEAKATATIYVTNLEGVFSWRNDLGLTGQNNQELALSPANLAAGSFGKLSSCAVDGAVRAQPLYVANLSNGSRVRNVLFVTTEHDSVYAFDADAVPCELIWKQSFVNPEAGITPVPASELPGGSDVSPEIGISGTPVIDPAGGTLYVVAKTREPGPSGPAYFQRVHALDLVTGREKFGGPVAIAASVAGTGDGSNGGQLQFDALLNHQSGALQLGGGTVLVPFGGHSESGTFHGWLLAYDAATLALRGAFSSTPNGWHGAIGPNGAGPSVDSTGNVFVATGRGAFDFNRPAPSRTNYGQTLLKLQFGLVPTIADSFTPYDAAELTGRSEHAASTGVLLLPEQAGAANPRLAVIGGTHGVLYLLDRDRLGGFTPSGPDGVIKSLSLARGIYGTPAYWQSTLYVAAAGDTLKAFPVAAGTLATTPSSQTGSLAGGLGASPVVSSNGAEGGVVWVLDSGGADAFPAGPAVLRAYDAADLSGELFSSAMRPEDAAGPAVKLVVPTVANGKVYVGTQDEVTVYGLRP
jgi:hypothetical protein